ncbi:YbbR-like domain-containing protein [Lacticaseibacillus brantae]|uniref:YbbR like protein n=1 Tax=Lacticaseibacillus brantae DSM 23927 TaxID=1423727 RepID=A0A0R2B7H5_9LACO|nr:CdaR family protein [Lacticaseibacillus brantae]KRM72411.1 YbbR like protein [Lacticaseibacillus brantae DSM 23927]
MSKFWNSSWFYRLLAFILTIALFAYVNVEKIDNTRQTGTKNLTILATKKQTVSVPLQINANTDKYFITGYPQKVKVTLEGNASLVTVSANTQSFRVIADLTNLGIGKHTVQLREEGLNKDLAYSIEPKSIEVNIQTRDTKTMPVQVKYNKDALAEDYVAGRAKVSSDTVEVTGARSEIDRIYQVVANVALNRNTKNDVEQEALLQALDSNGNTVNVVIAPQTVHVTLPVSLPSKKVDLKLKQSGTGESNRVYVLDSDTKTVTIHGPQAALDKISSVEAAVDLTGVQRSTTKTVDLKSPADGVTVTPESVSVNISATASDNTSASNASSSSSK